MAPLHGKTGVSERAPKIQRVASDSSDPASSSSASGSTLSGEESSNSSDSDSESKDSSTASSSSSSSSESSSDSSKDNSSDAESRITDRQLTCRDCSAAFTFTAAEQQRNAERGFTNDPSRCDPCKKAYREVLFYAKKKKRNAKAREAGYLIDSYAEDGQNSGYPGNNYHDEGHNEYEGHNGYV